MEYINLTLLWALFYILHSVLASNRIKLWVQINASRFNKYYRIFYNLVSLLLLGLAILYQSNIVEEEYFFYDFLRYEGYFLMMLSLVLMYFSFKNYQLKEFVGFMQMKTDTNNAAISDKLEIGGLNAFVRHPLYFSMLIFFAGYLLYKPSLASFIFVGMGILYLFIATRFEEQKLLKQFGEAYEDYQKKVPMLIPKLTKK